MKLIFRDKNKFVLRFDRDEELVEGLKKICQAEKIEAGWFSVIGACREVAISSYAVEKKEYRDKIINENLEIIGLIGNVAKMGEETIIHCHGSFSDAEMLVRAGHVKKLVVSATCEVMLEKLDGKIEREHNEEIGLNLMK